MNSSQYCFPLPVRQPHEINRRIAVSQSQGFGAFQGGRDGGIAGGRCFVIREGLGKLSAQTGEIVTFTAPQEPGLCILEAVAAQGDTVIRAEATITVSESLMERETGPGDRAGRGLPGYTFLRAPGELWRSRYDEKNNLIVVNNGHRDYLYAAQKHARKLKYICRLFAKELVLANFPGFDSRELLERVIALSLYAEENLR